MTLLESLLDAIVRLEGDALVMHVGEKPYVVTTSSTMHAYRGPLAWGQVELSSRILTPEAVMSMVSQILPADRRQVLDQLGAVEHEIVSPPNVPDKFTVVAARGGDDVWLELRRQTSPLTQQVIPQDAVAAPEGEIVGTPDRGSPGADAVAPPADAAEIPAGPPEQPPVVRPEAVEERVPVIDEVGEHVHEHVEHVIITVSGSGADSTISPAGGPGTSAPGDRGEADMAPGEIEVIEPEAQHVPTDDDVEAMLAETTASLLSAGHDVSAGASTADPSPGFTVVDQSGPEEHEIWFPGVEDADSEDSLDLTQALNELPSYVARAVHSTPNPAAVVSAGDEVRDEHLHFREDLSAEGEPDKAAVPVVMAAHTSGEPATVPIGIPPLRRDEEIQVSNTETEVRRAVVPMSWAPPASDRPAAPPHEVDDAEMLQMLEAAADRGASTMYVVAQSKPMVRVDGEIGALESYPALTAAQVERLQSNLAASEVIESGDEGPLAWISDVPGVGRVRCVKFRDHRGPGLIFRMSSQRTISADHLGLPVDIRDLCTQTEGLVVVAGPRGSGRSTLLTAFLDLINRTRSDHIISIESQLGFVHESVKSFVSQREARGEAAAAAAVAGALREDPDVILVDDVVSGDVLAGALEAAQSGRLVFACVTAPSAAAAVGSMVELFPEPRRGEARMAIASALRAVVSQMLVRKLAGGRVAARELLLNTPSMATAFLEGKTADVAAALEGGARQGMIPLTDSLAALVRDGIVHSAEAYRKAPDRASLLAALTRDGVDTAFAEKLA